MTRTRTYSWEDPQVFVDASDGLTGLEFLNKIGVGELPLVPAGATTNILPVAVGDGWAWPLYVDFSMTRSSL